MNSARDLFLITILKRVKIKVVKHQLELMIAALKHMVLICDITTEDDRVDAFNAYRLIMRLEPKLMSLNKQHTITLNISECQCFKKAYMLYPTPLPVLIKVYMVIDSQTK